MARLLLIDDHPLLRAGLASSLAALREVSEVVQAGTSEEGLTAWRRGAALVLVDLSLPDGSGFALIEEAQAARLPGHFIVLSAFDDQAYRLRAQSIGARAFVSKSVPPPELVALVRDVLAGRNTFRALPDRLGRAPGVLEEKLSARLTTLTATERRVLELLGRNLTSREIAVALDVSPRTVENHRANVCRKLELRGPHRLLEVALLVRDAPSGSVTRTEEP